MKTLQHLALTLALGVSVFPAGATQATFSTIHKFTGSPDGQQPEGLVAGPAGVLYGTTTYGGPSNQGTVFQLTPPTSPGGKWTETLLHAFTGQDGDGANPFAPPTVGPNGNLYGTTANAGGDGLGMVWELQPPATPGGTWIEKVLYSPDGEYGQGLGFFSGVIVGSNHYLYTVTSGGGDYGLGTVTVVEPPTTPGGAWSGGSIYQFTGGSDGKQPAGIAITKDGVIYGTTSYGGSGNAGVVFALTPSSLPYLYNETTLYSFTGGADGGVPFAAPVISTSTQVYGTIFAIYGSTTAGGFSGAGTVFQLLTPEVPGPWDETVLYNFNVNDGRIPDAPVIVNNGIIYGATATGSETTNSGGSVFQVQQESTYPYFWIETVLHNFPLQDTPIGTLVLDKTGTLYGATASGPTLNGDGVIYKVKP